MQIKQKNYYLTLLRRNRPNFFLVFVASTSKSSADFVFLLKNDNIFAQHLRSSAFFLELSIDTRIFCGLTLAVRYQITQSSVILIKSTLKILDLNSKGGEK